MKCDRPDVPGCSGLCEAVGGLSLDDIAGYEERLRRMNVSKTGYFAGLVARWGALLQGVVAGLVGRALLRGPLLPRLERIRVQIVA